MMKSITLLPLLTLLLLVHSGMASEVENPDTLKQFVLNQTIDALKKHNTDFLRAINKSILENGNQASELKEISPINAMLQSRSYLSVTEKAPYTTLISEYKRTDFYDTTQIAALNHFYSLRTTDSLSFLYYQLVALRMEQDILAYEAHRLGTVWNK